jgi:GH24 family phage-related lysozyme (muramidase)
MDHHKLCVEGKQFTFNVGNGAFQPSRLGQCVNRGHHSLVPHEFMKWVQANEKALPGLIRRRTLEAALYRHIPMQFDR